VRALRRRAYRLPPLGYRAGASGQPSLERWSGLAAQTFSKGTPAVR
jgi:hypothetical protein